MKLGFIKSDQRGAAVIEMAFALPALVILIWAIVQLGMMFRAILEMAPHPLRAAACGPVGASRRTVPLGKENRLCRAPSHTSDH